MDDYVSKPVRIEELISALNHCRPLPRPMGSPYSLPMEPGLAPAAHAAAKATGMAGVNSPPAGAPIDREVLEGLWGIINEGLTDVLEAYFESTPKLLATMREAVDQGDAQALFRAAYNLKPNSAMLGAIPLATLCEELERIGRAGTLEGAAEKVRQVEAEYERVTHELKDYACSIS